MKIKISTLALLFALLTLLTGCGDHYPDQAVDGSTWNKDWTILGTTLGVEDPGNGFTLLENPVVLTGDDLHYATWAFGQPQEYINAEGDETDLYDAELYLLLCGCESGEYAEATRSDWIKKEEETYDIISTEEITINNQDYTLLTYHVTSDENPYSRGASAFGIFENYCVSAELSCLETYDQDATEILSDFLAGCHYSAE